MCYGNRVKLKKEKKKKIIYKMWKKYNKLFLHQMKVMKDSSLQFDTQNNLLLLPSSVSSMSVWRMAAPRLLLLLTVSHHTRYLLVKTDEDDTASRRANMRNKGTRHSINQALMNLTMALLNLIVLVNL